MNNDVLVLVSETIAERLHFQLQKQGRRELTQPGKLTGGGCRIGRPWIWDKSTGIYFLLYSSSDDYCEIVQGKFPMLARSGALCSGLDSGF